MTAGSAAKRPAATTAAAESLDIAFSVSHPRWVLERRTDDSVPVGEYLLDDARTHGCGLVLGLQAPVEMPDHDSAGHQHDDRGDAAEDQSKKSKSCTVGGHRKPLKITFLPG